MIKKSTISSLILPENRDLYYGGQWHTPMSGRYSESINPGTGESLGNFADADARDMGAAISSAQAAFKSWRKIHPLERAKYLRKIADVLREHGEELAMLDAADCGNPVTAMLKDIDIAVTSLEYFAGLVLEAKGESIPMGPNMLNFTVREPMGVIGRIMPFNHPLMFCAAKMAAPIAAGNTVIIKPPEQASLSSLRFAELIDGILPPGVFNVVPGGPEAGAALASHQLVAKIALIGSVPTGRAVMNAASASVKPQMLELGGKNAFIAFPDSDLEKTAAGLVKGMNFAWCGQSCGSTSRAFLHEDLYDAVLARVKEICKDIKPGIPTDPATKMGAIINQRQFDRIMHYIEIAKAEGAKLLTGGQRPDDAALQNGFYIEPTIFFDVTPEMTIAREEIFGPVLSVIKWNDEQEMLDQVNAVEVGLSCAIWTRDLVTAHRVAAEVQAGFVWINNAGPHFQGAPFGGYKQSGIGREECLGEMLDFTQQKNINVTLD